MNTTKIDLLCPPTLICDGPAFEGETRTLCRSAKIERRIVWTLIVFLADRGFGVHSVDDGESTIKCKTPEEAMEAIFSVDESILFVRKPGKPCHFIRLVGGNEWDIISGYGASNADGFADSMSDFCAVLD